MCHIGMEMLYLNQADFPINYNGVDESCGTTIDFTSLFHSSNLAEVCCTYMKERVTEIYARLKPLEN